MRERAALQSIYSTQNVKLIIYHYLMIYRRLSLGSEALASPESCEAKASLPCSKFWKFMNPTSRL